MRLGAKRDLHVHDLYEHLPADDSERQMARLAHNWRRELHCASQEQKSLNGEHLLVKSRRTTMMPSIDEVYVKTTGAKPSLLRAIYRTFGGRFMIYGIVLLFEEIVRLVQPLFIGGLVRYFRHDAPLSSTEAYLYALGLVFCAFAYPVTHHPYFYAIQKVHSLSCAFSIIRFSVKTGMHVKTAISALLFDKALKLNRSALHKITVGHIVNLLSTDVAKYDFVSAMHLGESTITFRRRYYSSISPG